MLKKAFTCLAVLLVAGATVVAADVDLDGVKCVVAAKNPAKADKSVDYKEGKVYFCCANCPKKFAENSKKFAAQANHQLVATKQYEQKACPISGRDLNPDTGVKVAGIEVTFCCNNCKGKVEGADEKGQLAMVFGDKAFEKAFKKVEKKDSK